MAILAGKKGIVMGVANDKSIATAIAKKLIEEGASVGISHLPDDPSTGRTRNRDRASEALNGTKAAFMLPCEVSSDESMGRFFQEAAEWFGGSFDFVVHSIAFAPMDDIRCKATEASRKGFALAMDISVYSFLAASNIASRYMKDGGSVVGMTYFGGEKVMPGYNMMGVCKAALDASIKYAAYDLGQKNIRVNGISAGPIKTLAASAVGDFKEMLTLYEKSSPMRKNITQKDVANTALYLISDLGSMVSGEILHVDGGYHAMGVATLSGTENI